MTKPANRSNTDIIIYAPAQQHARTGRRILVTYIGRRVDVARSSQCRFVVVAAALTRARRRIVEITATTHASSETVISARAATTVGGLNLSLARARVINMCARRDAVDVRYITLKYVRVCPFCICQ